MNSLNLEFGQRKIEEKIKQALTSTYKVISNQRGNTKLGFFYFQT